MTRQTRPEKATRGGRDPAASARLRILATTDLHMQLTGFDYVADTPLPQRGLAGLGTLIATARAEAKAEGRACLLVDNGDTLQGTPLGTWLAGQQVGADHPIAAAMNHLRYDAVGVGNHDLDFGLPYLRAVAARLNMPVLASNLTGPALSPLSSVALVKCDLPGPSAAYLRIGVLSVLPARTADWNRQNLLGEAGVEDPADSLRRAIPQLRARGADVIVVLAHLGIWEGDALGEQTALDLAAVPGIDAMVTGHTHRRFPGSDHPPVDGIHPVTGRLMTVPTVMPGHGGSDLAVLDLTLNRRGTGPWQVIGHVSGLRANRPGTPADPAVVAAAAPAHAKARAHLAVPLGQTTRHLHNYFSMATPSGTSVLSARAEALMVRAALGESNDASLPLLVATSAHTAGGREGPDNYLSIPEGPVRRRHLAGLDPYANEIWAVRITGQDLLDRLEHSAAVFNRLRKGGPDLPLRRADVPAFNFETIHGVRYLIDPTRPAGQRVGDLRYQGAPVERDQPFLLVSNQFRAAGGGGFRKCDPSEVALRLPRLDEAAVIRALEMPEETAQAPWAFAAAPGVRANLYTTPDARGHLSEIAHLAPQVIGHTSKGFLQLRLHL